MWELEWDWYVFIQYNSASYRDALEAEEKIVPSFFKGWRRAGKKAIFDGMDNKVVQEEPILEEKKESGSSSS